MTTPVDVALDGRFTRAKLTAVLAEVCDTVGLDHRGATLLRYTNNAVFRLPVERAVVRIVCSRAMRHRVSKVVQVAQWLAEHDVPAVRLLSDAPQPVRVGPHLATLWHEVPGDGPAPTGSDLARLLRQIHELPAPSFRLPNWEPLDDVRRRLADAEELDDGDLRFLLDRCDEVEAELTIIEPELPQGVVHGDAHLGNLIAGPEGPVICDFDSTCVGPREWDLTPMPVGMLRFGHPVRWHRQLARGYGFDVTRWRGFSALRQVRELKLTTSVLPILRSNPDVRVELRRRLTSFRSGDASTRWGSYR